MGYSLGCLDICYVLDLPAAASLAGSKATRLMHEVDEK